MNKHAQEDVDSVAHTVLSLAFYLFPIHTLSVTASLQGNELVIFMMKPSLSYSLYLSLALCFISLAYKMTLILSALPM